MEAHMLVCEQVTQRIEEVWTETIHWVVKTMQKICEDVPWPLSWLCKIVTTILEWFETIVYHVIQVIVSTICHVVQAVIAIIGAVFNLVVELWLRVVGVVDLGLGLLGVLPIKLLRLHVVVLMQRDGNVTAMPAGVDAAIKATQQIFRDRASVKVVPTVHVMEHPAPDYALQIKSGFGCVFDQMSDAGAYFRFLIETELTGLLPAFWLRMATPIVAFIVQGVGDETTDGCSSGPLADYICVEGAAMNGMRSTLAHEMSHACGLLHDLFDQTNLMYGPGNRGTNLSPLQRGIVRGSTHVTYY
jgi:hypothetical protein